MSVKKNRPKKSSSSDIPNDVLHIIKKQNIKCKPKYYFVIGSLLVGIGVVVTILISALLIDIKLYQIEMLRPFDWLGFGMAGIWPFLILFPWRILTLALGALVLGVYLIRMSSGTSHFRNLTIAMIIVMISFTGAVVFARLGSMDKQMNDYLSNSAIFSYLYDNRQHGSNWLMGKVMGIEENYLTVDCPSHDRPIKVMMNPLMMNQYKNGIVRGQDLDLIGRWRGLYSFEATAVKLINR